MKPFKNNGFRASKNINRNTAPDQLSASPVDKAPPGRAARQPVYLGLLRGGCPEALVNSASPGTLPETPLSMRVLEVPTRAGFEGGVGKRPIHAGVRACSFAYSITTKRPKTP